jgi:histidinol dehydrogenase
MRVQRAGNWFFGRTAGAPPSQAVAAIIEEVREGGDHAVLRLIERFDHAELGPAELRVDPKELEASVGVLEPAVLEGLRTSIANVRAVAKAQVRDEPVSVELAQGHTVEVVERPVGRAAVYVPGGRAPYPSTVVMGAITARVAGVEQVAVCAPPGPGGRAHPVILAACVLCEVNEVYRMGGAQAIAALACGTETIRPADVIVGPGNLYVQEAKRQVSGLVGIDGFAGPSDLLVLASAGADPRLIALDLLAQAEHGEDSLVVAVSDDAALLDAVGRDVQALYRDRSTVAAGPKVLVDAADLGAALAFSEALAPEHLQLMGEAAEALAPRVRRAGCLFVGAASATAFGDYVAGSNHTLPTDGAARFASGLTVAHFRRRMAEVHVGGAAGALARAGVPVAEAEGFAVHAESMSARIGENR